MTLYLPNTFTLQRESRLTRGWSCRRDVGVGFCTTADENGEDRLPPKHSGGTLVVKSEQETGEFCALRRATKTART